MNFILPETRFDEVHFCRTLHAYLHCARRVETRNLTEVKKNAKKDVFHGIRVIQRQEFGTKQNGICAFLLLTNSNLGHILHAFGDMAPPIHVPRLRFMLNA